MGVKHSLNRFFFTRFSCLQVIDSHAHCWLTIACGLFLLAFSNPVLSEIHFEEVSVFSGVEHSGPSYGASWGDFDGDGLPDLWVNNHIGQPNLYRNNGDGTFTDIILDVWSASPFDDTHGATWGDFDNDGDQDLIELAGAQAGQGQGPNHLFVNEAGLLIDKAVELGLDYPLARGRTALWFDWNNDGLLDVLLSARSRPDGQAPSCLFEQTPDGFYNVSAMTGFDVTLSSNFAQLSDLNGDSVLDVVIHGLKHPQRVYDVTQQPFVNLVSSLGLLPQPTNVWDAAIADFNGDLQPDLFVTRIVDPRDSSDLFQEDTNTIKARLVAKRGEVGICFRSAGDVLFDLYHTPRSEVYIGSGAFHPASVMFKLSPDDPTVWGIPDHTVGLDVGTYIGYDPDTQVWRLLLSTPAWDDLNTIIKTIASLSEVSAIGFDPNTPPLPDRLLVHNGNGFTDQTSLAGLDMPTSSLAVAAGDLDNDMDVDLYLVCNHPTRNIPNILYENMGNGTFIIVPDAGGAEGSNLGRGENVALADFDLDGFLDLFVTNGMFNKPFNNGPQQLFRNLGNTNHWIEIDLQGLVSNRDAIGVRVLLTAGGITQLREQGGGVHRHAQNHQRIHFGLGPNDKIDRLIVHWPSGIIQELKDIPANQILSIQEQEISISTEDILTDERAGKITFTVVLSQPGSQIVTVNYATTDQTAIAGEDYIGSSGQVVFNPGETEKRIIIDILPDDLDEPDEAFQLNLNNASNAYISRTNAICVITRFPIWFLEVTEEAGISYVGQTIGASWGDFNGDGYPDLWVSNHYAHPSLYLNHCKGNFSDVSTDVITWDRRADDSHGAAWADFDNDGDQDIFETSGDFFNIFYENKDGRFEDIAAQMGVQGCPMTNDPCTLTRARTPLWLDWNNDGILDLLIAQSTWANTPPSALFRQTDGGFEKVDDTCGFDVTAGSEFAQLADLSGDGNLDLLLHGIFYPNKIYDITSIPFADLGSTLQIPKISRSLDVAIADFDGNLTKDIFIARGANTSDVVQTDSTTINLRLTWINNENGISFRSEGTVSFDMPWQQTSKIYIGENGFHPHKGSFTLSTEDPNVWGLAEHTPGAANGIYIGFDPGAGTWTLLRSSFDVYELRAVIKSSTPISDLILINFKPFVPSQSSVLLFNRGGIFADETINAGVTDLANCSSIGSGDFDNDMDIDVYLVCNRPAGNANNLLYVNEGSGNFSPVPYSGGAAGSNIGYGDSVAIADYDCDGFLDLFVTNSDLPPPFIGPHQLFRNTGNKNHWIEIDLEGILSNRDGIGARILATTPDGTTQMREQSGGMHRYSQNHQRIHIGLGSNTELQGITIFWPSGIVQQMRNIPADQILHVVEPIALLCEGDFDRDGDVDGIDLSHFAADFGRSDCGTDSICKGDIDKDGDVDGADLNLFSEDFGRTDCAIAAVTP